MFLFIDGTAYNIKPGRLLLVHPYCHGFADYSNDFVTEAICVFISHEIMNKGYSSLSYTDEIEYAASFASHAEAFLRNQHKTLGSIRSMKSTRLSTVK